MRDARLGDILAPRLIHPGLLSSSCHRDARREQGGTKTGQWHAVSVCIFVCVVVGPFPKEFHYV